MSDYPRGHKGFCCADCIDERNEGYIYFDLWICCCLDKRPTDVAKREWERWFDRRQQERGAADALERAVTG